jgi:hypothetical protein
MRTEPARKAAVESNFPTEKPMQRRPHKMFIAALGGAALSAAYAEAPPTALTTAVSAYVINKGDDSVPEYKHAIVDLNDDHMPDAVVLLQGPIWCGSGGCRMLVFKGRDGGYTLHSTSTVSREPIRLSPEKSHGWHTLIVHTKGAGDVLMTHGNKGYPANASHQKPASKPQLDAARTLIN